MNEAVAPAIDCDAAAALLESLTELVIRAGRVILAVDRSAMKVGGKSDGSPVTEADLAADRIIMEGLSGFTPGVPALSEERALLARPPYKGSFFLVDPLDGTKEFISGNGEFTVNIGLIEHRVPVLGVVLAPARGLAWWGAAGHGAHRRENDTVSPIQARRRPATGAVAVASRASLSRSVRLASSSCSVFSSSLRMSVSL